MKQLKALICLVVVTVALTGCRSNEHAVKKVTDFGNALKTWSENKFDGDYELEPDKFTAESTPVNSELMANLAKKYPIVYNEDTIKTYNIEDYKTKLGQWFEDDENVILVLSDIKAPNKAELEQVQGYENLKNQLLILEGNLTVKNYREDTIKHKEPYEELYYIRRRSSKIIKISPKTYTDTGRIRLDFSDIEGNETVGASVNYSPNWPVSLSASYSYGYLMIGIDGGYNPDHDQVVQHRLSMTDVLNYTKEDITYDPNGYITITPSVYLKYLSIGCGAGLMFSQKTVKKDNAYYNYHGNDSFNTTIQHYGPNESSSKPYYSFMLRPNIKGYIPLNKEWYLTFNASYDWAMDIKIKNGMSFGLGIQYRLY